MKEKYFDKRIKNFLTHPRLNVLLSENKVLSGSFLILGVPEKEFDQQHYIFNNWQDELGEVFVNLPYKDNKYFYVSHYSQAVRLKRYMGEYQDMQLMRLLYAESYEVCGDENELSLCKRLGNGEWLVLSKVKKCFEEIAADRNCIIVDKKPEIWHLQNCAWSPENDFWAWRTRIASEKDGSGYSLLCGIENGRLAMVPNLEVQHAGAYNEAFDWKLGSYFSTNILRFELDRNGSELVLWPQR